MSRSPAISPGHCQGCHAEISWVQMGVRKDGSPGGTMPCNKGWAYGDGKKTLVLFDDEGLGHVKTEAPIDAVGLEPHWGSCPARQRFKKQKPTEQSAQASLFN